MATTALLDDLNPAAIARHRVERLLNHFRRFLAPDDDKILSLEERLMTLQAERLVTLHAERLMTLHTQRLAVPDILAHR